MERIYDMRKPKTNLQAGFWCGSQRGLPVGHFGGRGCGCTAGEAGLGGCPWVAAHTQRAAAERMPEPAVAHECSPADQAERAVSGCLILP